MTGDTNGVTDIFVRLRGDTWSFTSYCFPGENGVIACPCGNASTTSGRGCDNFGSGPVESARISARGDSALSNDTVVLTSAGENDTSLTVFVQGSSAAPTGAAFGAGVGCVAGGLIRLYTGGATGGSISRPGVGDPTIAAASASHGHVLSSGDTRYYFAYYRDPQAGVPCGNASIAFNCTQAGMMTWGP